MTTYLNTEFASHGTSFIDNDFYLQPPAFNYYHLILAFCQKKKKNFVKRVQEKITSVPSGLLNVQ